MALTTNSNDNPRMVTGLFNDRTSAERAYQLATERGYAKEDINLVMSDDTRMRHFSDGTIMKSELGNKATEGAGVGGVIGGTLGAVAAAVAAIGTNLVMPGLGLVVAGPLAAGLAGAGAGGVTGSVIGALVGSGMSEERVKEYEEGIKNGGILMGVNPRSPSDAEYIERQWRENKGENVYS